MGVDRGVLTEAFGNNPTIAGQAGRPTSIMHVESRVFWLPTCDLLYTVVRYLNFTQAAFPGPKWDAPG